MNFNASGARQPHKLAAKRLRQGVEVTPNNSNNYPPPYDPFTSPQQVPAGPPHYNAGYIPNNPNLSANQFNPMPPMPGGMQAPPPYVEQSSAGFTIPSQLLTDSVVKDAAMQYGQHLMGTGKEYVNKEFEKYVPVTKLKYYFAVDTAYVAKKLRLLMFPYTHTDWSVKYAADGPVQPRFDVNAPDLYIPTMAYITYVLVAGLALGTQNRFTPEVLGIQASSALAWTILEIVIHLISLYITNIQTSLTTIDILAFCGYKFVGIIIAVLASLAFQKTGYYLSLIFLSLSLCFFLVRTLKLKVLQVNTTPADPYNHQSNLQSGNKRRMYLLLIMAGVQPFLMWWLSYHLVPSSPT